MKLSFRELCNSKLTDLGTIDYNNIIKLKKVIKLEKLVVREWLDA